MAKIIKPLQPVLVDKVIEWMQTRLSIDLIWLDYSFGRVQRLVKKDVNGADVFYPAMYLDSGEYMNCLPDQDLGNIMFFTVDDPQNVEWNPGNLKKFTVSFSIIFWYDIMKSYGYGVNSEYAKGDIIKKLSKIHIPYQGASFTITKIYDKAENIYKGFSLKEVKTQFLMFPYSGVRFEGELTFMENCTQ